MKRLVVALLMLFALNGPAFAVRPDEMLADPALEARARVISGGLRCLVCQNESIDDSDADLAHDLRVIVRERITAGDTDDQVRAFLVARYGEYVLLNPVFAPHTLLLWVAGPLAVLFGGVAMVVGARKRRKVSFAEARLTADEQAALDDLSDRKG
jgi:cytochrome c-type biogenesis protein CcmH